jgi:IrrE N-terminal-like domain
MEFSDLAARRPGSESLGHTSSVENDHHPALLHRFRSWLGKPPEPASRSRAPLSEDASSFVLHIETSRSSGRLSLRFHAGAPAPAGHPLDRHGFLRKGLRSIPDRQFREHEAGLSLLGGLARALGLAWAHVVRSLASKPLKIELPSERSGTESALLPWAASLASHWCIEVEPDSLDEMEAFLLQTGSRSVIYLKKNLEPRRQALGVCHELAHHVLGHRSNSSYGLDPRWLAPEDLVLFERQEAVADALASLWIHLFTGLTDAGRGLAKQPPECSTKRCTSRARESFRF